MNKTSCCDHSYLGIREKHFKLAISERILTNGQRIPCLNCRSLYEIENYSLKYIGSIPTEIANVILKESTELLFKGAENIIKEENADSKFMSDLGVKW
jgi:hypothetical protein